MTEDIPQIFIEGVNKTNITEIQNAFRTLIIMILKTIQWGKKLLMNITNKRNHSLFMPEK